MLDCDGECVVCVERAARAARRKLIADRIAAKFRDAPRRVRTLSQFDKDLLSGMKIKWEE